MGKKNTVLGKIKWFNLGKGIGIIESQAGDSYLVHTSDFKVQMQRDLKNKEVRFILDETDSSKNFKRATEVYFHE